ncbi:hypothetical protein H0H81_002912 [Sphagnurus paluster]|uniref:Glutathione S-transferase UstS-like C-terminal domain-containing protein n=1 Tax=Sphagnurus paluster TaxID=117069 RepID=A0A9P7FLY8_9AGAR|nr:hypothetical protein H0H81_002912 [Sphagnurus paluster]
MNTTLAESALIAEYLDSTYPDTPKLFLPGTRPLQYAFIDAFMSHLDVLWQFTTPATHAILNPPSQAHVQRTREAAFGRKLEEIAPTGTAAEEEWAKVKSGLEIVAGWQDKGKNDRLFFLGKEPMFVDFAVASFLMFMKKIWGEDSSHWRDILSWSGGRWGTLLKALEKYETAL